MSTDPVLEKAIQERQRCVDEANKWQVELEKWDDFIARYSKMTGAKPPANQLDLPLLPTRNLREKAKGREIGEPRKSITEWMRKTINEKGSASYEEVCTAFPHVDKVLISKILDRNRKYGFDYEKSAKAWTFKGV